MKILGGESYLSLHFSLAHGNDFRLVPVSVEDAKAVDFEALLSERLETRIREG